MHVQETQETVTGDPMGSDKAAGCMACESLCPCITLGLCSGFLNTVCAFGVAPGRNNYTSPADELQKCNHLRGMCGSGVGQSHLLSLGEFGEELFSACSVFFFGTSRESRFYLESRLKDLSHSPATCWQLHFPTSQAYSSSIWGLTQGSLSGTLRMVPDLGITA